MKRWARYATILSAFAAASGVSRAFAQQEPQDEQRECARAYEAAQELRLASRLLAAREQLQICRREQCKEFMSKACTQWFAEVSATICTVTFDIYQGGRPVPEVTVLDNGKPMVVHNDDDPLELDPGEHRFEVKIPGAAPAQRRIVLQPGEKNRLVRVLFPLATTPTPTAAPATAQAPTPPPKPEAKTSSLPYVFLGVGALGVSGFAALGILGMNRETDLRGQCAPNCDKDELSSIRAQYLAADISLGVGLVALGIGTVLWLFEPPMPARTVGGNWRLGLAPTPWGATGQLQRSF